MKKLLLIFLFCPVLATAQTKPKKDTIVTQVTDTTGIVSMKDLNEFIKFLGTIPYDDYIKIDAKSAINLFWNWKQRQKK